MKKVTKTVELTKADVMVVYPESRTIKDLTFELVGKFDNPADIINELSTNDYSIVPVKVNSFTTESVLLGMDEKTFLEYAVKLEKRNPKLMCRTFYTTHGQVMAVNTEKGEVINLPYTLAGMYTEKELLNTVKGELENSGVVVVKVLSAEVSEELYGIDEQIFAGLANRLPERK